MSVVAYAALSGSESRINKQRKHPEPLLTWNHDNRDSPAQSGLDLNSRHGYVRDFLHTVTTEPPEDNWAGMESMAPTSVRIAPMKQMLGVLYDSPNGSPGPPSSHLALTVLNTIAKSLRADALTVAVLHPANRIMHSHQMTRLAETIISTPPDIMPDAVSFGQGMLSLLDGQLVRAESYPFPHAIRNCLGSKSTKVFQGIRIKLAEYDGVAYAVWTDASRVQSTATEVMARAAKSLPLLLANRASAWKIGRIGRQFDAILKRMPQPVVFVDDDLAQVVVNPAAAELLNLPAFGEVDPMIVAEAMRQLANRSGTSPDLQKWFGAGSNSDTVFREEWTLSDPKRVLRVESYPISSTVNSANGRLWMFQDLTAERDAREAIAAANHNKSQFLATMSHELRTPMTGVLGMLDLLKLTPLESEQKQLLKVMQSSAEGLMTVINNILDFCKMEAGRLVLEDIDFQVCEILESVRGIYSREVEEKGLELKFQQPPQQYQALRGDPVRLKQIVANLVSNAVKFTDKGSVTVSWHQRDPPMVTEVKAVLDRTASAPQGLWGRDSKVPAGGQQQQFKHVNRAKTWPMDDTSETVGPLAESTDGDSWSDHRSEPDLEAESGSGSGSGSRSGSGMQSGGSSPPWDPSARPTYNYESDAEIQKEWQQSFIPDRKCCGNCGSDLGGSGSGEAHLDTNLPAQVHLEPGGNAGVSQELTSGPGRPRLCRTCVGISSEEGKETAGGLGEEASGQVAERNDVVEEPEDKKIWFRITVSDTGCGMSEEQLASLFDGSKTPARWRDQEGTGLGLSICKGLLFLMGGSIWGESYPGKGSKFSVAVPLSPAVELVSPANLSNVGAESNLPSATASPTFDSEPAFPLDLHLNVLVAEDNKVNQLLIRRILKHYGHEVELVGNGKLALEAVQMKEYDMVLMDLQMPILDGLSATKAIRALPLEVCKIPIYALTADVISLEIEEAGMDGFLSKPIVWDKLSHVVDKVLARKAVKCRPR